MLYLSFWNNSTRKIQQKKKVKESKKKKKKKKKENGKEKSEELEKNFILCVVVEFVRWWGKSLLRKSNKKGPKTMCILVYVDLFTFFFRVCLFDLDTFFICLPDFLFFCWWPQKTTTTNKKIPTTNFCSRFFFDIFC